MACGMSHSLVLGCVLYAAAAQTKLKLGQDVNYPPYASKDPTTGKPTGFGADIAKGMDAMDTDACSDLDIEVVETRWANCWTPEGLGALLEDGTLDACMTYTHTKGMRTLVADFSNGILSVNKAAGLVVLLDENGQPKISGLSDLSGKTVVDVGGWAPTADGLGFVENKCTNKGYADDYTLLQATDSANNNDLALDMLLSGKADAMFLYADQAYNYKKVCKAKGTGITWNCSNWEQFGKKFAYVQTGQFGYVNNGTTLALTKKGSGVVEKLNPCLQEFMGTKEYYDICVKYDFVPTCYPNKFFPAAEDVAAKSYNLPADQHAGDCSDGYCPCPTDVPSDAPSPPPAPTPPPLSVGPEGNKCCTCIGALPEVITRLQCDDKPYKDASGQCVKPTVRGKTALYPTDYGTVCKRHLEPGHTDCYDIDGGEEKHAEEKGEWCDDPWCYIDPCNCNAPSQYKSDYFAGELVYTYLTCTDDVSDNIDRYSGTVEGSNALAAADLSCSDAPTQSPECVINTTTPDLGDGVADVAAIVSPASGLIAILLCSCCLF